MRQRALACTWLILLAVGTAPLAAQPVRGIGDDATTPRSRSIRVELSTSIADWSDRYGRSAVGVSQREPLGYDFTTDTLGVAQFPGLGSVQGALRTLTGNNAFTLSLGRTALAATVRTQTTPIMLEVGVSNRLSFGVLVPFVSARTEAAFNVNPRGVGGNVSVNPARLRDADAATNALLVSQVTAARDLLAAQLASCTANPASSASCPSVLVSAPALTGSAAAFAQGIATVYGTTRTNGAAFVPYTGSAADSAIRSRVSDLRAQFAQFGINAIAASTAGPAPATSPLTPLGLQNAIADSSLGLVAAPLRTITRQGIGDIELSTKLRLFDSFGFGSDTTRYRPLGLNIRQSVGAAFRLGTGSIDQPDHYLDVGTGQGQNDIEVRSFTDVVYGRRFFGSLIARYTVQLADEQQLRITDRPEQVFAPAYRERLVNRNLGDQLELVFTPRFVLSDYFSVGAQYLFRHKAEDVFSGTYTVSPAESGLPAALTLDASTLRFETAATEHRAGLGLSFSSVAAYSRGTAKFPVEIHYLNSRTIAGRGGAVAKLTIHEVQLRFYPGF